MTKILLIVAGVLGAGLAGTLLIWIPNLYESRAQARADRDKAQKAAKENKEALDVALNFQAQLSAIQNTLDAARAEQQQASTVFTRSIAGARATTLGKPADSAAVAAYNERLRRARLAGAGDAVPTGGAATPAEVPGTAGGPAAPRR